MTMEKNILKSIKRELDEIKKEAKSEELEVEDIIFDEYDEALINEPTKRNFKAKALKKGMAAAMLGLTLATGFSGVPNTNNNMATVEAAKKKDKKKPVIKFAGSSKIETEVNKTVKIPKTTAKDNKDGNVTKKIAVKVTKGKKQFKTIAKKIKSNKAVKFTSTGSYVITYTVKDKAGNKATKKRYVTVKEAQKEQTTRRPAPARVVPAPATTEAPKTTEIPTTEAPTTEAPATTEDATTVYNADLSKFCDYTVLNVNGNSYNVASNLKVESVSDLGNIKCILNSVSNVTFSYGVGTNSKYKNVDNLFYYFLGDVKAYDGNVDVSKNIVYLSSKSTTSTGVETEAIRTYVVGTDNKLHIYGVYLLYSGEYEAVRKMTLATRPEIDFIDNYVSEDSENEFIISPSPLQKEFKFNDEYTLKLKNSNE